MEKTRGLYYVMPQATPHQQSLGINVIKREIIESYNFSISFIQVKCHGVFHCGGCDMGFKR